MYSVSVTIAPPINLDIEVGVSSPATGGATVQNSTLSYQKTLLPGEVFTLPNVTIFESDGVTTSALIPSVENYTLQGVTVTDGGGTITLEDGDSYTTTNVLKIYFNLGDLSVTLTADADSIGTYTAATDDGGSGTISYEIDTGGGFGSVTLPFTLNNGDELKITRTITTGTGFVRITP